MSNWIKSAQNLEDGLKHHDDFGAAPNESPIYIEWNDCGFELPTPYGVTFNLGDLRNVLSYVRFLESELRHG